MTTEREMKTLGLKLPYPVPSLAASTQRATVAVRALTAKLSVPPPRHENLPHILRVIEFDNGEREWDVEHPPECPRVCFWSATTKRENWSYPWDVVHVHDILIQDPGHYECAMQYELDYGALDSLDEDWRELPPGTYEIVAWFVAPGPPDYDGGDSGIALGPRLDLRFPSTSVLSV